MSVENLTLICLCVTATALPVLITTTILIHVAHAHDLSLGELCTCWACLLANKLDRHHGRHRLEDHYDAQRYIRADFHRLRPDS